MIIIKGQNDSVGKYIKINIGGSMITATDCTCLDDESFYILGKYKDVERAKEVMEEIEEHIRQAYVAREFKVSVEDFNSLEHKNYYILNLKENAIYTMPKE